MAKDRTIDPGYQPFPGGAAALPETATEANGPTEEAEESTRRSMHPELKALSAIIRLLDDFEGEARFRLISYLTSLYQQPK